MDIQIDLTDNEQVVKFFDGHEFDVLVHCAAERRPDVVLKDPKSAEKLNEKAPGMLAKLCSKKNIFMVYVSTDYVFDGKNPPYHIDASANPINEYGVSKLNGENAVISSGLANYLIIRIPILYGEIAFFGESSVDTLLKNILSANNHNKDLLIKHQNSSESNQINFKKVEGDLFQVRFPTLTTDVARVICEACTKRVLHNQLNINGIAHFSAKDPMTKYDMCKLFCEALDIPSDGFIIPVKPDPQANKESVANRPENCELSVETLESWGIDTSYQNFDNWWLSAIPKNSFISN
ncbi:hypothetical protein BB558_001531 [Smittium angustum]|uniref:RmlD-like substrate binding domain-containing protein n=1 Tax=Smittium angustum TaxID=133377 RepID=A0A2U1JBB3_SMIAN|nr:hypothetical protein BB558_001531 [Smittium angustum]